MHHHGDGFEPRLVSQFFNRPFLKGQSHSIGFCAHQVVNPLLTCIHVVILKILLSGIMAVYLFVW